jgi:hypothetical protein
VTGAAAAPAAVKANAAQTAATNAAAANAAAAEVTAMSTFRSKINNNGISNADKKSAWNALTSEQQDTLRNTINISKYQWAAKGGRRTKRKQTKRGKQTKRKQTKRGKNTKRK